MPRPRKSRALRLIEGNRSKTKIPDEPLYSGKFPRAPSFIEGIGRAPLPMTNWNHARSRRSSCKTTALPPRGWLRLLE